MSEAEKEDLKKLIMSISEFHSKDEKQYKTQVNFMNAIN